MASGLRLSLGADCGAHGAPSVGARALDVEAQRDPDFPREAPGPVALGHPHCCVLVGRQAQRHALPLAVIDIVINARPVETGTTPLLCAHDTSLLRVSTPWGARPVVWPEAGSIGAVWVSRG